MPRGLSSYWGRLRSFVTDDRDSGELPEPGEGPAIERSDVWRRASNWAAAHPLLADTILAALVAVLSIAWLVHRTGSDLAVWAVQAALIVPLAWRRHFPVVVFCLVCLAALTQWLIGVELVADLALLVALFTVASHRPRPVALAAGLVVELGAALASSQWSLAGSWLRSLVFLSGLAAAALLLGVNVRARRGRLMALTERAARLERERDQQALIATAAERTRIAREMHDVIAHSLAVMISLADGAAAKLRVDPAQASEAIASLSSIGRQALGETRRLLGVLRNDDTPDGLTPQPGVAQLDDLLAQVRSTGLRAAMTVEGRARALPAGLELTAYRIVQEAATNTLKHAVQASCLAVTLLYGPDELGIVVCDDGKGVAGPVSANGGGHGLAGMRERASLYNGQVSARATARGWEVRASLPLQADNLASNPVPPPGRMAVGHR